MSTNGAIELSSIAVQNLAKGRLGSDADPEARVAADAAASTVNAVLSIADSARSKLSEIQVQEGRGLLPAAGATTLRDEVISEAKTLARDAERQFETAHNDAVALTEAAAIPKVDPAREILARQEFSLALGDAKGSEVSARLLGLAKGGSDEARAIINTSFARQALVSKGVADVDNVLSSAKQLIASQDERVGENLAKLDNLATGFQASHRALGHSLGL
jgi:hypothetical protein